MENKTIRGLRISKGLTQVELGKMLGVKQRTVSRWEKLQDVPDLVQSIQLAKVFGVTLEEVAESLGLVVSNRN